jgi:hypothetical protein
MQRIIQMATNMGVASGLFLSKPRSVVALLMAALAALSIVPQSLAAGVVGTGTSASCTEAAFDTALSGGGIVTFNCGPGTTTITLTATKTITAATTIVGDDTGVSRIVISGGNAVRLFTVSATLDVGAVSLINGRDSAALPGAAAINATAPVALIDVTVSGHQTSFGGCPALVTTSQLNIIQSTISGNVNTAAATGKAVCGNNTSQIQIVASTLSGNTGGALQTSGIATLLNVTVANNTATGAGNSGGIASFGSSGNIQLINSIVANNIDTGSGQCGAAAGGVLTDSGGNLQFPGVTCGAAIPSLDPLLAPLANNGGLTQTMALLSGSPAIDRGVATSCNSVDQRNSPVTDGDGNGSVVCDSGAFEAAAVAPPPPTVPALSVLLLGLLSLLLFSTVFVARRKLA